MAIFLNPTVLIKMYEFEYHIFIVDYLADKVDSINGRSFLF